MSFTGEFLDALARLIEGAGIGDYQPTGPAFTAGQTAIVHGDVPATPDRLIVLTRYGSSDDPTQAESTARVQFRTRAPRGGLRASEDLQDALFDLLHNMPRQTVGPSVVVGCWRTSTTYLGVDGNSRPAHTGNYEFQLHRPGPHRT